MEDDTAERARALLAASVLLGAAYTWSLFAVERPAADYLRLWDGWVYTVATGIPALLLVAHARVDRERRVAWLLIAGGVAATWVADLIYSFHDQNLEALPVPGLSDGAYVLAYPFWWAGIVALALRERTEGFRSALLDGPITGLTASAVAVALWLPPLVDRASVDREVAVGLAFAVCDLLLVVLAITALLRPGGRPSASSVAVVVASVTFAIGDILYLNILTTGEYAPASQVEALYIAAIVGFGIAPWLSTASRAPARVAGPGLNRISAIAALVSVAVLASATVSSVPDLATWMATLALCAALLRVLWTVRELQRMNEVYEQARTDELTGLANRRSFLEQIEAKVASSAVVSVAMVDLDGFKEVNDSLGHPAGDRLLVEVGARVRAALPAGWSLARLGGDEFGLIATCGEQDATLVAGRVRAAIGRPIELEGIPVRVAASIGVSTARPTDRTRHDLVRTADVAMYEAKRGTAGVVAYRADLDPRGRARLALVDDLCHAIDDDALHLVYQPILQVDGLGLDGLGLDGLEVGAVEALVRWDHPERGLLLPDEFLPVARRAGLVTRVTRRVVARAIADVAPLWAAGRTFGLHVNIVGDDLVDESFAGHVLDCLRRHGVPPERLTIELAEEELVADQQRARRTIERLRRVGVQVAIDDFGVGRSSLADLLSMPLDQLKIDRSLIRALETDPRAEAIVRSAVELGRTLVLDVIAEGVESPADLAIVRRAGVQGVQGFHLEVPASIDELAATVERRAPRPVEPMHHARLVDR